MLLDQMSRSSKSFSKLLEMYELANEDFCWEEGWYTMLETNILNELGFRILRSTPQDTSQLILRKWYTSSGESFDKSSVQRLLDLVR